LSSKRKWRAITFATLVLVPGYWALLAAAVSAAPDTDGGPNVIAALALGLTLVPFSFIVLALLSEHPRAPGAVLRAMGLAVLVGLPVSAIAGDAVTGIVAGVGAGGIAALRMDEPHDRRTRIWAVVIAALYTFTLVRLVALLVLLPAPIFPYTALGLADHWSERRVEREAAGR
jgi:hypothetical protein